MSRSWVTYEADGRIIEVGTVPNAAWDLWTTPSETATRREIPNDMVGQFQPPIIFFVLMDLPLEAARGERRMTVVGRTLDGEYICRRNMLA
jgi:hypothetical protein